MNYRIKLLENGLWTVPQGEDKPQSYHCRLAIAAEAKRQWNLDPTPGRLFNVVT